jgi:hypothetical protein
VTPAFDWILAVDWGRQFAKRRAWLADVEQRTLRPLEGGPWSLATVMAAARALPGRVLVGIDAALGVPDAYLDAARAAVPSWASATDFLCWLRLAVKTPQFLEEVHSAAEWTHARPFIAVPKGQGALGAFWARAGGRLLRSVDAATRAKSLFVVSGIPGTVGSGTRVLWCELAPLLDAVRDFSVWPFEGSLAELSASRICLAEIYPRVCYAIALDETLPARLRDVSKVHSASRDRAIGALLLAKWVNESQIVMEAEDLGTARRCEDDFDAMISAAALLRCMLEKRRIDRPGVSRVEGDMLGVGLLDLTPSASRSGPAPGAAR